MRAAPLLWTVQVTAADKYDTLFSGSCVVIDKKWLVFVSNSRGTTEHPHGYRYPAARAVSCSFQKQAVGTITFDNAVLVLTLQLDGKTMKTARTDARFGVVSVAASL
jgi:hypothetical protein